MATRPPKMPKDTSLSAVLKNPDFRNSATTDYPSLTASYRWTIRKFRRLYRKHAPKLESPGFTTGSAEWHLELCNHKPDASTVGMHHQHLYDNNKVRLTLVLDKAASNPMTVETRYSMVSRYYRSLIKDKALVPATSSFDDNEEPDPKTVQLVDVIKRDCSPLFNGGTVTTTPWSKSVDIIETDKLLKNYDISVEDDLTVLCELKVSFLSALSTTAQIHPPDVPDTLANCLGSLLQSGGLSDITLVAGEKDFPAHRIILSARSPVFKAMFQHNMREKTINRMDIEDLAANTVKGMLQWMYTGQLPATEQESRCLLCAADKYNLEPLKLACERVLRLALSVQNAADLMDLADLHHADSLKSDCVRFIAVNSKEVKATEGWKRLERKRVDLLAQLAIMLLDL